MVKLSVLDQSPIRKGGTAAQALAETVDLAQACEAYGYERYWLAEHHNTKSFAGSAPEIMIGKVAGETRRMRVGAGGVMLPHYSPLKVAEHFRLLETLYPGRIDLGLGRAPGSDPKTAAALQPGPKAWPPEVFPQQVQLLIQFLEDASGDGPGFDAEHPYRHIHACPRGPGMPEMWLLGSGGDSGLVAAHFGTAYCYAHFIGGNDNLGLLAGYRQHFRPSAHLAAPKASAGVAVICAETEAEAERLAATRNLWVLNLLKGQHMAFPSIEEAQAYDYTEADRAMIDAAAARAFCGTPDKVQAELSRFAHHEQLDELVVLTITYDHEARKRSYQLLAEAFGLDAG